MMSLTILPYTIERIPDAVDFEKRLRQEEDFWGWEIDDTYLAAVEKSFCDERFSHSLSLLAYREGKVVGRIDSTLICSHFDGSVKAYLDWICVIKSARHQGVAQALMENLQAQLKERNVDTLIALTAQNEDAQRFYKSLPHSPMRDMGIWIDIK